MTYKGYKITVKREKSTGMLEARLWVDGRYYTTMPTLFELKQQAIDGVKI